MSYFDKFDAQEKKLTNVLHKAHLLHVFNTGSYPMTLTITQDQTSDAQMALYDNETDGVSSFDSKLVFTFYVGKVTHRFYERFIIDDELFTKIKNIAKKMNALWLQADHAKRMEWQGMCGPGPDPAEVDDDSDSEDSED